MKTLNKFREKRGFICDMDGVLYHGNRLLPDVTEFTDWLKANKKQFLFLTNSSERSPHELQQKLDRLGIKAEASHFYTSALATALILLLKKLVTSWVNRAMHACYIRPHRQEMAD